MRVEKINTLLVRRLVEAGQDPDGSVSIAELHKVLLPYSECRAALGFVTKAEYDIALLHLLGDAERVEVDDDLAKAVEMELGTPEPGLAFLKNYAAAQFRVRGPAIAGARLAESVAAVARGPAPPEKAPEEASVELPPFAFQEEPAGVPATPPATPSAPAARAPAPEATPAAPGVGADAPMTPDEDTEGCWSCDESLPSLPDLRYCPHCGADQTLRRCRDCEAEIEMSWSFCPRCGTAAEALKRTGRRN